MKLMKNSIFSGILDKYFLFILTILALTGPGFEAKADSLFINLDPNNTGGTAPDYIASYTEGNQPVNLTAPDAEISDQEGIGITYLEVIITNPRPGDILTADTAGTGIIFQYDQNRLALTGMTPGGQDAADQYQKVLQTVSFANSGTNPDTTQRIIEFTAYSGETPGNTVKCLVTIISINSSPVNTVPGSQMTPRNLPLIFDSNNGNRISVSDEEALEIQVSLSIDKGVLNLPQNSISVITGNNTSNIMITGTVMQVNSDLDGLKYEPEPGWFGNTILNIETSDLGFSGIPGPLTDIDIIDITVGVTTEPEPNPEPDPEPDGIFNEGETVTLNIPGISDSAGEITSYEWNQVSGPDVTLSGTYDPSPSFVAPIVNNEGALLEFELIYENQNLERFTARQIIRVNDNAIIGYPEDVLTFKPDTEIQMGIKIIEGELVSLKGINPDEIEDTGNRPENLIYGLINMQIKIPYSAERAVAEIYFPEPAGSEFKWFGYDENSGWSEYDENSVFSDDRRHVSIFINGNTDDSETENIGDNNNTAEKIISNTSGLGKTSLITESGTGDSGGGCFVIVSDPNK